MPLTRSFKDTIQARVTEDAAFREALLEEAIDAMLAGDVDTGKTILRTYINATLGFEELSLATGTPAKSLMRMFALDGNPNARNLFAVIRVLQERSGFSLEVRSVGKMENTNVH